MFRNVCMSTNVGPLYGTLAIYEKMNLMHNCFLVQITSELILWMICTQGSQRVFSQKRKLFGSLGCKCFTQVISAFLRFLLWQLIYTCSYYLQQYKYSYHRC